MPVKSHVSPSNLGTAVSIQRKIQFFQIIRCCISNHTVKCNLKNEARRTTGKHMQKSGLLFVTASADPVTVIVCEASRMMHHQWCRPTTEAPPVQAIQ